jgi:hypothetical protein
MAVHGPLNAFSFDISLVKIGQEIKLLEHLKKNWITLYLYVFGLKHNNVTYITVQIIIGTIKIKLHQQYIQKSNVEIIF